MNNEVIKILRLVEKGLITKEQGYILIKAHYENIKQDIDIEGMDSSILGGEQEEAIESSAELIDELIEATKGSREDWAQAEEYEKAVEGFVRGVICNTDESDEEKEDNNNFIKRDYYLAGEKVYDQRNVSLKSIRRGKKYKENFLLYEIKDSGGECIPDKALRAAATELINENFCGRYRRIKNGNVIKIFIE